MSADNSIVEVNVHIRLVEAHLTNGQRIMAEIEIDVLFGKCKTTPWRILSIYEQ